MKQSILFFFIMSLFFFAMKWYSVSLCMTNNFSIKSDDFFSISSQSDFIDQLSLCVQKKKSIKETVYDLKNTFLHIKNISIVYRPTNCIVTINSYKPICILNEKFILLDNKSIFDKSLFTESEIIELPSILISQEIINEAPLLISQLLHNIPISIYTTHIVRIITKNHVTLTDKNNMKFSIVCSSDQYIPPSMFDQCEMVKKNIITHGLLNKNVAWIADVRFANYIVTYKA